VFKRLNYIATLQKNKNPKVSAIFKRDAQWVHSVCLPAKKVHQCGGKTKSGKSCKRMTHTKYCNVHSQSGGFSLFKKKSKMPTKEEFEAEKSLRERARNEALNAQFNEVTPAQPGPRPMNFESREYLKQKRDIKRRIGYSVQPYCNDSFPCVDRRLSCIKGKCLPPTPQKGPVLPTRDH
jgi:hypothetical protein